MMMNRTCTAAAAIALAALSASAAHAESVPRILASARLAEGAKAWRHAAILVATGTEQSSGLSGHWRKVIDASNGRAHESVDFGYFKEADVWDGQNYWRQDRSGGVHPVDSGFAKQTHVTDAWILARGYLSLNALGAKLESQPDQSEDGRSFSVIHATPRDGQPVDLWFDKATNRLAETIQTLATNIRTVHYDDYRNVRGAMLPFRITTSNGTDADTDVLLIDAIDNAPNADREFVRPQPPDDFTIAGGKTTVPIEFDGEVVVEAKLDGQGPFVFILDTGGHDILTPDAAKALNLKPVGAGASGGSGEGTLPVQFAHIDRMDIGGLTVRDQPFVIIPLQYDTVERGARPPLSGILGLELFERFAMRLDYRNSTLSFEPLATYQHTGAGIPVPIFFSDDQPTLVAKIDGFAGNVGLDTGNSGSLIVQHIWADRNGLSQQLKNGFPSMGFGMGGASPSWTSRADFEIAGRTFPRIMASYSEDRKGAFSSRIESGNVGNRILANFVLDFDYARGRIWFEPSPGYVPPPFGRAGVTVFKERADAFKIARVASGTPSAEAGLQVGDEITAVDGTPAAQLSGWDFGRAVRKPEGTNVTFSVTRDGKPQTVVVTLRDLLP